MRRRWQAVVAFAIGCGDDGPANEGTTGDPTSSSSPATGASATEDPSTGATTGAVVDTGADETSGTSKGTDTDSPPAAGARVLFVDRVLPNGEALFFVELEAGVATAPGMVGEPAAGGTLDALALAPGGDIVRLDRFSTEAGAGLRVRLVPIDEGMPLMATDPLEGQDGSTFSVDFADDGTGVLMRLDSAASSWHHVPLAGPDIGASIPLGPGTDGRYYAPDRVLLEAVDSLGLDVVAIDDPGAPHSIDATASDIVGVTDAGVLVYTSSPGLALFAARLEGVDVAEMARIDDASAGGVTRPSLGPDGGVVAYFADDPEALYVTALDGVAPGVTNVAVPAGEVPEEFVRWSPDGQWLLCDVAASHVILRVTDGVPGGGTLVSWTDESLFALDSSAAFLVPPSETKLADLLAVGLEGDIADEPYVLASAATYGPITRAWVSAAGGLAFAAGDAAEGQSLWYVATPARGAMPVELTAAPVPDAAISAALFSPDGESVVVLRGDQLLAIELVGPGVEIELDPSGVHEAILLP